MPNAFLDEVQKRFLFDKIAMTATGCLGPYGASVRLYPGGIMYGKVARGDVAEIIEKHLLGDEPVERLKVPAEV